jgi:hypothetical protein
MVVPGKGKVLIKVDPDETERDGFLLGKKEPSVWGEVVSLGAPMPGVFTWWEVLAWKMGFGHPMKVKGKALLPKMKGHYFKIEDEKYCLAWQTDIQCWQV